MTDQEKNEGKNEIQILIVGNLDPGSSSKTNSEPPTTVAAKSRTTAITSHTDIRIETQFIELLSRVSQMTKTDPLKQIVIPNET